MNKLTKRLSIILTVYWLMGINLDEIICERIQIQEGKYKIFDENQQ